MLGITTTSNPGMTGIKDIADALGGGIRENSFVLLEGEPETGKSVLCQYIAYAVLHSKEGSAAYFSSECDRDALTSLMDSMALEMSDELGPDRFQIHKMRPAVNPKIARQSLQLVLKDIAELPPWFKLVIVDSPSSYLLRLKSAEKMEFMGSFKELCKQGRTIIIAFNTHALEIYSLSRAYLMSDYYLKLKSQNMILATGQIDTRVIKSLKVTKLAGAERTSHDVIKFEIKPKVGIQILPFVQVKV